MIEYVKEFHEKFGLPTGEIDLLTNVPAAIEFREGFLQEELDELKQALAEGDRVRAFDALLDLAYVAYGTALFMGVSPEQWRAGMYEVQACNMRKERVLVVGQSKRGSIYDVRKPEGWVGPEASLKEILAWTK